MVQGNSELIPMMNRYEVRLLPLHSKLLFMKQLWCYDRKGNKILVSSPVTSNGKPVKGKQKTICGALLGAIGNGGAMNSTR